MQGKKGLNGFELKAVLSRIHYKDGWMIEMSSTAVPWIAILEWTFERKDVVTGEMGVGRAGEQYINLNRHDEESLVRIVFSMAKAAEEHECREWFMYGDQKPFDPHQTLIKSQLVEELT